MTTHTPRRVVIIGAGFAGLQLARCLDQNTFEITLIDRFNYHQFQPLFYQVATARIEPSSISFPLRKIFQKQQHVHVRVATVTHIHTREHIVQTNAGDFSYDILVLATGCTTNFYGNRQMEALAYTMKSTTEAMTLRNRILMNFEDALHADPETLPEILNIVVVGGGPTGVELAGALAEMKKNILPKDYPDMDFSRLNIYILEGTANVLGPMSEISHKKGREYLEQLGVHVWLNELVESYDGKTIRMKDGKSIPTRNVIWTAGVTGNLLPGFDPSLLRRGNRLAVDRFNRVQNMENVYAVGDIAYMETPKYPHAHPQVANVAINQAKLLARNLNRKQDHAHWKAFEYKDPGSMATVGKRRAVVDLPGFSFQGRLAWLTWMFLHLMLILSVRNKLFIFINWAISYFTNDTTLRLILLPTRKQIKMAQESLPEERAPGNS